MILLRNIHLSGPPAVPGSPASCCRRPASASSLDGSLGNGPGRTPRGVDAAELRAAGGGQPPTRPIRFGRSIATGTSTASADKVAILNLEGLIIDGDKFIETQIEQPRTTTVAITRVDSPGNHQRQRLHLPSSEETRRGEKASR